MLHDSDGGSEYGCKDYEKELEEYRMKCRMRRKGKCYDKGCME